MIPARELHWRFSRSSGPGGQSVNTTDSRVEVQWSVVDSRVLTDQQRQRLLQRLAPRLHEGALHITASDDRSQWQNRRIARSRLADTVAEGLLPPPRERRATKPSRGAIRARLEGKKHRASTKQQRRRPSADD